MRWMLRKPHYLRVPGTEWEFVEVDTGTGKQVRNRFSVPAYLDPADPSCCNRLGECIVCWEGKGQMGDTAFVGEPTPEMEPVDDEARAESKKYEAKWALYGTGQYGAGYAENMLQDFQQQLALLYRAIPPPLTANNNEVAELKELVAEQAKQIAELSKRISRRA